MSLMFCEVDFLASFFNNRPEDNIDNPIQYDNWKKYYNFFLEDGNTFFFDDETKYKEFALNSDNYKLIFKKYFGAGNDIKFSNKEEFIENINPHKIFFLSNQNECNQIEEDYGVLCFSLESLIIKNVLLFEQKDIVFVQNRIYPEKWGFLKEFNHPCNSLVIADNYLVKQDNKENFKNLKNNLFDLLNFLLPQKLNKLKFQLTIITGTNTYIIPIETIYNFILKSLNELRLHFNFELKIISKSLDNHDRNLITNYMHIKSGFGFTLFKENKSAKNTEVSIKPILKNLDAEINTTTLLSQFKEIESNVSNIGSQIVVIPNSPNENRLFNNL